MSSSLSKLKDNFLQYRILFEALPLEEVDEVIDNDPDAAAIVDFVILDPNDKMLNWPEQFNSWIIRYDDNSDNYELFDDYDTFTSTFVAAREEYGKHWIVLRVSKYKGYINNYL